MPYYGGTPMAADPQFLMDRLMANGMSRAQAAAVLGNLQRESGLASNNVNKDEGAYGLMQWRGSRFEQLQQFAAQKGVPWTDPGTQADFIAHEMATTERKNAAPFMAARTVDEASAALKPVIRYGDKSGPERAMHARNFFGQTNDARNAFGANDAAPQAAAAPIASATPATAQPPVSRETPEQQYYRQAYDDYASRPPAKGLRGGIASIGEALGAYARNPARAQANMQANTARIGNALGLGGGAPVAQTAPGADTGRSLLAARLAGGPQGPNAGSYVNPGVARQIATQPPLASPNINPDTARQIATQPPSNAGSYIDPATASRIANEPPGAQEPPRFPGGVPQPRPRPLTGPSLPPDDRLLGAGPQVAEMGSLVDPMGWDYG